MGQLLGRLTNLKDGGVYLPKFSVLILSFIKGYNHEKYWRRRAFVVDTTKRKSLLLKALYLVWIKRIDGKHGCSFGTSINYGASFSTPPLLPHGIDGIIVGHDAKVGKDCVIFQQVTIAAGDVIIGDNVVIGAGAKILPKVKIGNHCKIGANAVVVEDMSDYSTCVMQKPRIILRNNNQK